MKRHALDPVSLVAGLVFLCLGIVGASGALASLEDLRVVGPLGLLALGGLLVASAITAGRQDADTARGAGQDPANGWDPADAQDLDNSRDLHTHASDVAHVEEDDARW